MDTPIFNPPVRKKTANPSNADHVRLAKRNRWLAENKRALVEYNGRIESRGAFSDGLRRF